MKVINVEQVYLGYDVQWPTGIPATNQHTKIEMGAMKSKREEGNEKCGETKERRKRARAGGRVDEEVSRRVGTNVGGK